ncbi:hypothetical protein [Diaminobutyricibacter sp. McL0608]|uniref:hypothetical protein n=1 Tax=Leifsonia sp. McL0608 TaxID=3143537 RepID=UPI0031F302EB
MGPHEFSGATSEQVSIYLSVHMTDPLSAVAKATPNTVADAANVATTATGTNAIDATIAGTALTVPVDPTAGISAVTPNGEVSIGLPFAAKAKHAKAEKRGVVSYDNNNGSTTVPVVQSNGDVQINTIIKIADAPTRYSYPVTVPDGGRLVKSGDQVAILDCLDNVVAVVSAPWAKDAHGKAVPTHYEIDGTTLTQVVEHMTSAGVAYPVVADPSMIWFWWGAAAKYSKAETKTIAGYTTASSAVAVLCSWVPSGAPKAACALASIALTQIVMAPFRSAAAHGKCGQINIPYVPGVPPLAYEVAC